VIRQYDIYLVNLDPTIGSEIKKTRPCIVISPNEMNNGLRTVQVAPMTSTPRDYPWRVALVFKKKSGYIALDQIRTIDKQRLVKRIGAVQRDTVDKIKETLHEMLIA
jgi:mRNA interferase MazF